MRQMSKLMLRQHKLRNAGLQAVIISAPVMTAACSNKWESMPDEVLAAKSAECMSMNSPAAAMIQVCKNYERECLRRRESGVYIC